MFIRTGHFMKNSSPLTLSIKCYLSTGDKLSYLNSFCAFRHMNMSNAFLFEVCKSLSAKFHYPT